MPREVVPAWCEFYSFFPSHLAVFEVSASVSYTNAIKNFPSDDPDGGVRTLVDDAAQHGGVGRPVRLPPGALVRGPGDPEVHDDLRSWDARLCMWLFISVSNSNSNSNSHSKFNFIIPSLRFFVLAVSPIPSFHSFLSLPLARMGRGDAARQTVSLHLSPSRSASSRDSPLTFLLFFSPLPSSLVASSRLYSLPVALVTPPPRRRHVAHQSRNHSSNQ